MDSLITAAARALSTGDALGALSRIALREDAPALALRGIAMAQLGDLPRARDLLRRAAAGFGAREPIARSRCLLAQGEIALVSRDLGKPVDAIEAARAALRKLGDRSNAAHAGYLDVRRALLLGDLDAAQQTLASIDTEALSPASLTGYWLVTAGIAMRKVRAGPAQAALDKAVTASERAGIPSLTAEVDRAIRYLAAPAACLVTNDKVDYLLLADVEALFDSHALIIDACRYSVRKGDIILPLSGRPVLFTLLRVLGENYPAGASREVLLQRAFRAKEPDDSHRARLRVEIGRLRQALAPLAGVKATQNGFILVPSEDCNVAVLVPAQEDAHQDILALLADGEAWSSSALALVLNVSARTVQRALENLARDGKAEFFGQGRSRRWIAVSTPGFPTSLLLPATPPNQLG